MRHGRDRGQAAAELAILLPVLVLILLGCLDLGRVFSVWLTLSNATREGARYAASHPKELSSEIVKVAELDAAEQGLPADEVLFAVVPESPSARAGGQPVTVTARYSMSLAMPSLLGMPAVDIQAQTRMIVLPSTGGS